MNPRRKLVVTGAHGFVAGSVLAHAGPEWALHAVSRGQGLVEREGLQWHRFDPSGPGQWEQFFHEVQPDAVIHTAALADIDFCQAHPDLAHAVNVDLTRTLAEQCARTGARLVFCSTDTVFDGEHAPYQEDDPPGPVNVYAKTKVKAEEIVAGLGVQAVIARLSLVVGLPFLGAGNSFLVRLLASLKEGRTVAIPAEEIRTPVDAITLGRALVELAGGDHRGIFHLAGHSRLSRFEMGQRIAQQFGFSVHQVAAQTPSSAPGRAARPRDVSLDNSKACALLKTPMCTLENGLSLILQTAHTPPA